jgi:multiple sugar transport system substrate-binding protein
VKRRRLRLVALSGVLAIVSTACLGGGNGSSSEETTSPGESVTAITPKEPTSPVTITFSSWVGDSPQMKQFASDFHSLHPNITIEFQAVSADNATTKLTTQVAGGTAPDVAFVNAPDVQTFASRDALVNLDGYVAGSDTTNIDDFVPGFLNTAKYQDSVYGIPFDGETTGIFYRTDMFQAAGITDPPATWEEFQADAAKLTDPANKQYGFIVFAPEAEYYWEPFLWQAGGHLMADDNRTITFNDDAGKQAAEFYVGLRQYSPPDYYSSNSWDGRVAFATGKVAMYEAGAWFGGEMKSSFPKIDGKWSVAPMPSGPAGCATTIAGDSLVVFDQTDNADAAWMWVEYLTDAEHMKTWTFGSPTTTLLPPRQSLLEDPDLGKYNPWLEGFAEQMKCAVTDNTDNPKWAEVADALNTQLGKAIFGEIPADEALDNAANKGEQILASA